MQLEDGLYDYEGGREDFMSDLTQYAYALAEVRGLV
jgi:hypothetical protein